MKPSADRGYRWLVLLTLSVMSACNTGVFFLTPPLAPFLQADLGITRTELGLLMAALLVGAAVMSIPGGWLADRSIRWAVISSEAVVAVSLVFFSSADSLELASLGTLGMGLGAGAALTCMTKAIAGWFPSGERATALGLYFAGGSLGSASGAVALPALSLAVGWRQAVLALAAVLTATAIAGFALYRESPDDAANVHAISNQASGSFRSPRIYSNLLILGLFSIAIGAPQYAAATYIVLYVKETLYYSVVDAGMFLAIIQGSSLFGRIGWGVVSDRLLRGNRKAVLLIAGALFTVSLSLIAGGFSDRGSLTALMVVMGVSGFSWYGIWVTLLAESSRNSSATFIGFGQCLSYVGVIVGPPLFGYIVDTANSYIPGWIFSAVLAGLSTMLIILVTDTTGPRAEVAGGAGPAKTSLRS